MKFLKNVTESVSQFVRRSGLAFTPIEKHLQTSDGAPIPDRKSVWNGETGLYIATVGIAHHVTPPAVKIAEFEDLLSKVGGTLQILNFWENGGRYAAKSIFPTGLEMKRRPGDKMDIGLSLVDSITGEISPRLVLWLGRQICSNGMGVYELRISAKAKRTKNHESHWHERVSPMVQGIADIRQRIAAKFNALDEIALRADLADKVLRDAIPGDSRQAENARERVLHLAHTGRGNTGETLWDLFNGVTEWTTHERSFRETANTSREDNAELAEYGVNQRTIDRFWESVRRLPEFVA